MGASFTGVMLIDSVAVDVSEPSVSVYVATGTAPS